MLTNALKKFVYHLLVAYAFLFFFPILAQNNEEWETKFEKSSYLSTDNYENTIKYFEKIAESSEFAELKTIGISPKGRKLKCLIVSKDKLFDPKKAKESNNATILINNGIHAGEVEGKDACMLMLREMLITGEQNSLLENVTLLIIPVFNVDGHERSSKYGRINQNGPSEMGWRTTAQNLNLNRDFTKADSPEMKAFLKLFKEWLPDIFIDTHTTNGADYQYTITYGISKHQDIPPITREIVIEELIPVINSDVASAGYLASPFVSFVDGDYVNGIKDWFPTPRFSNGYAALQNRIGLLIETHMLKPYKDRVFSTKVLLESVINFCNSNSIKIKNASIKADEYILEHYTIDTNTFPLKYDLTKESISYDFKGYVKQLINSRVAGRKIIKYTNEETVNTVPYFNEFKISDSVNIPTAYLLPKEWSELIPIIKLHGIRVDTIRKSTFYKVEKYEFKNVSFADLPYEGRFIPMFDYDVIADSMFVTSGDYYIPTSQRSLGMIIHLLEPKANDSFVRWGFMNIIFERKEYFEEYSMEPIAAEMYNKSANLREEFNSLVKSDTAFAKDAHARLNYFYENSPYYDQKHNVYPIMRVVE